MEDLPIAKAFTLVEPGPVILVTTNDGRRDNVMAISWTMVLDFTAKFAITTGAWNYSYAALTKTKECVIAIPAVDLLDTVVGVGTCSGKDTDKFEKFGLTRVKAKHVGRRSSPSASPTSNAALPTSSSATPSWCSRASPPMSTAPARRRG